MNHPHLVSPPSQVWRIAIASNGRRFSRLDPADASSGGGNRFDVPGAGVLYCCTTLEGCYRETLARMRVSPAMRALDEDSENHFMRAGCVPASWRDARRIFQFSLADSAPFLDVENQATWNALEGALAGHLTEPLDVAAVRGPDRTLTRAIAAWAYGQQVDGYGLYAGIRYLSRLGEYECWAVFDGALISEPEPARAIELSDSTLQRVSQDFGLTVH